MPRRPSSVASSARLYTRTQTLYVAQMAFVIVSHHEINMLPTYARMTASTFGEQATARPGPGG